MSAKMRPCCVENSRVGLGTAPEKRALKRRILRRLKLGKK